MAEEKRNAPLSVTIYNPALLKKEDLIRGFVARQPMLDRLLDDLRREAPGSTPQHQLIIGQRGLGKTTLLRRVAFAVEDDSVLAETWMPLVFPEEQYNVASLADFWLNCVDALSDALDRLGDTSASKALDSRVERVPPGGGERSTSALNLLLDEADRLGRRFLLLVDNIDIVLERLKKEEEWEFRRVISEERRLHFIGASSRVLETLYEHGRAFYEFFQIHELKGFDEKETFSTLCHLAEESNNREVERLVHEQPSRIKALRVLTGGNPRTLVLLFKVLSQGPEGDVQRDIEQLLDEYTALYKGRFEELPPQAQQVVDAMAIHWDPLTAADLVAELRNTLGVNQVSAQLKRLEDFGIVEKTPWFGEKKNAFQIAERFFNIWYLMRASRRVRRRLLWLVRFLETWYDREELNTRARGFLERDPEKVGRERYAEMAMAYSQAVPDRHLRRNLESAGLHAVIDDGVRRLIDFSDLPPELQEKRDRMQQLRDLRDLTCQMNIDWDDIDSGEFWRLLGGSPHFSLAEKARMVEQLASLSPVGLHALFDKLQLGEQQLRKMFPMEIEAITRLYEALAGGEMADVYDFENATAVAKRHSVRSLPFVAIQSRMHSDFRDENLSESEAKTAESALRGMATEEGFEGRAWNEIGDLLSEQFERYDDAERAYRRAGELNPNWGRPWNSLGNLLQWGLKRYVEAEQAYRRAIEIDPKYGAPWANLGDLLRDPLKRYAEAEEAYRRAIALDPQRPYPFNGLGDFLQYKLERYEEAEQAYRDALALDTRYASAWFGLGYLLSHAERYEEAEQAYRRAIKLEARDAASWNNLGNILDRLNRNGDAEQAYRHAIKLEPEYAYPWSNLGRLLARFTNRDREAAEASLRAFELDKTRDWDLDRFIRVCARLAESPNDVETALGMARKANKLAPESIEVQFLLPRILVSCGRWQEAIPLLEQLAANESTFYSADFFRAALKTGHLNDAIAVLERTGADERWRPLYEALRAARAGTPDYLRTVAPEVRVAAAEILRDLSPELFRDAEQGPV